MTVGYRNALPGDFQQQRELFKLSFPETAGTAVESEEHYRWKFRGFPAAPPSYEYVGEENGVLAAYYAAIPYPYQVSGRPVAAGMVCDVMTHPSFRGRGLFTGIGRYATGQLGNAGIGFVTGYPIRPEVLPGHLKVGWRVIQRMPVWLRMLGTRSLLPPPLRFASVVLNPLVRVAFAWARPAPGYTTRIVDRDRFLEEIADTAAYATLLQRWKANVPNALDKTADFMRWRTAAPGTAYHFMLLLRGEALVGLAVVRDAELKGIACLAVLDLMIDPEHQKGVRSVHHGLAAFGRSRGRDALACMSSVQWARNYGFVRSGYLRTPAVFSLIVKKLDPALTDAEIYDDKRWHTFWLDSDDL